MFIFKSYLKISHKIINDLNKEKANPQNYFIDIDNTKEIVNIKKQLEKRVNGCAKVCNAYENDEALEEAQKDLGTCYKNILKKAHLFFTEKHQEKNIAIPPLSRLLGFPSDKAAQVAVASGLQFIADGSNKDKYGLIEVVVNEQEDFYHYVQLLNKQVEKFDSGVKAKEFIFNKLQENSDL